MAAIKENYDVIVVGAGIQGLAAAHTFLSIEPSLSLLIIDAESSVGGTWCKERVYPDLRANNLQGYFEYTDFPMLEADVGVKPRGLITGEAFATYLHKYAQHFDLLRHVRFNTKVVEATNQEEGNAWTLKLADSNKAAAAAAREGETVQLPYTVSCAKLLVATGQTSRPSYPSYPGTSTFRPKTIHTVDLATESTALLKDPAIQHITILGGGKSAHDTIYRLATAPTAAGGTPKRLTWLIRKSGRGGLWLANSFPQIGPFRPWLEHLLMTRPLSWFGAAPWSSGDGFGGVRSLLHNTAAGRFVTRGYFANMSKSTVEQSGILKSEDTKLLAPKESLMWYGGQASVLNYDGDFYEAIRAAGVEIVHEDIESMAGDAIVLKGGRRVETDALVCATGYEFGPSFKLLPEGKQAGWGVPIPAEATGELERFEGLDKRADEELFERFPELRNSPGTKYPEKQPAKLSPWRLWRFVAPPSQVVASSSSSSSAPGGGAGSQRNLVFLTNVETYENVLKAELVSLWAYAYLNDELVTKPEREDEVAYEAALWSRFGKWRCPMGTQGKTGDTLHDNLPYYDTLLRDLGLNSWRKGWGLLGEVFGGSYELKEYRGIVQEWMASRKKGEVQEKTLD